MKKKETEMMDCPKCKKELIDGCTYCPSCGQDLSEGKGNSFPEKLGISRDRALFLGEAMKELVKDAGTKSQTILRIHRSPWEEKEKLYVAFLAGTRNANPFGFLEMLKGGREDE